MERQWSEQQRSIFDWFETGSGHLVVRARAGTGKTTTILEGINRAPERNILLAAFNKRIATELETKLTNPAAKVQTLHAAGFGVVRRYWERTRVDQYRGERITRQVIGDQAPDIIARHVQKLAGHGKEMQPHAMDASELIDLAYRFECVPDAEWTRDGYDVPWVAAQAVKVMEHAATVRDGTIDFADMIYLPVRNQWARPTYDLLCVDEAQDMNATQLELATGLAAGRICVIGDDRQAIYAFRGADSGALDRLKDVLSAQELGLTTTYRCPKVVVQYAATLVPDFSAADTAPDGEISSVTAAELPEVAQVGDFILSRKNAPLAGLCLRILRTGKRARIEGKDIGAGLIAIVRKQKTPSGTIDDLLPRIALWAEKEIARALKAGPKVADSRIEYVTDQKDTLEALAEGLEEVPELISRIELLFADDATAGPRIVLSTVHKAKGLEADRVFILRDTLYCRGDGPEERNIEYVAVTRAKSHLTWVEPAKPAAMVPQTTTTDVATAPRIDDQPAGQPTVPPADVYALNCGAGGIVRRCARHGGGLRLIEDFGVIEATDWQPAPGERCENCPD